MHSAVLCAPLHRVLHCSLYRHNKADPSKQLIVFLSAMFCTKSRSMTEPSDMLQNLTWRWIAAPWCRPPCGTTARPWLSTVTRTHAALLRVPLSSAGGKSTWARTITWGQWHSLSTRVSCNRSAVRYLKKTTERQFFKSPSNSCASSVPVFSKRFVTPRHTLKPLFAYSIIMCIL